jgi:hypothetical protein
VGQEDIETGVTQMIEITAHVSGGQIASSMSDDIEEAAQFFPEFATSLSAGDWSELKEMLKDELFADHRKDAVKRLGELLLAVSA